MFGYATGWLGWTPAQAWSATPQEITDAFAVHIAALKAVHGTAEEEGDSLDRTPAQIKEQSAQNIWGQHHLDICKSRTRAATTLEPDVKQIKQFSVR